MLRRAIAKVSRVRPRRVVALSIFKSMRAVAMFGERWRRLEWFELLTMGAAG
jgi:hypothetical protein